jgi:hypothetical protein
MTIPATASSMESSLPVSQLLDDLPLDDLPLENLPGRRCPL